MPWTDSIADAYRDLGQQTHVDIIAAAMERHLGPLSGKRCLDVGCARGELSLRLARQGADAVICYDENRELLEAAGAYIEGEAPELRTRFTMRHGNETGLPVSPRSDLVFCSLAMMMCETRERLDRMARGLIESMAAGGRCVVVLTHPCFHDARHRTFHIETPSSYTYWAGGTPYEVVLHPESEGETGAQFTDYHWPLEAYMGAFASAGASMTSLIELPGQYDTQSEPQGDPAYIVLEFRRMITEGRG